MNKKLSPLERFWMLIKPDSKDIINIYIFAVFNGIINLSLPLGIQTIINLIQVGQVSTSWIVLIIFVLMGITFSGVMQIYQLRITENLQQKIFTRAAFDFAYRIPHIKMEELYKHYIPELMNRFFDTITLQKGLSKLLLDTSLSTLQLLFSLILLSLYHPFFIILSLASIMLVYIILKFTAAKGLKTSIQESRYKYRVAYWLEEGARTATTFKLAGTTNFGLNRLNDYVNNYLNEREKHFKILVSQYSLLVIFKVLVAAGLLFLGGILVMEQIINIGQFVAAEIIIIMVLASVEKLILSLETIYDVLTSLDKLGDVVDLELENDRGTKISEANIQNGLAISLKNVSFTYPNSQKQVIKNINLDIESGERVLITGDKEAGKGTLLKLIAGLYSINEGSISCNDIGLNNLSLSDYRTLIGSCLSHEKLFHGSIVDNITIQRERVNETNVQWAIKNLFLDEFINELPAGLNTVINPEVKNISKSALKKILIARSIVNQPKLLLLEEPFVGIESNEKRKIIEFLTNKNNLWTLIISCSDPEIYNYVNKNVVLNNGEICKIIELNK